MKGEPMIEWVKCPMCGKNLLRADATGTLKPWCKSCKKEVEIKIEMESQNDPSRRNNNI
jgi:phage FluMu protein Com